MRRSATHPHRLFIALMALVLLSGLMPHSVAGWVAQAVGKIYGPLVERPSLALASMVGKEAQEPGLAPGIQLGSDAYMAQNLALAETVNAQLRTRVAELEQTVERLGLIQEAVGNARYKVVPAQAKSLGRDRQRRQLTINRGSTSGIQKGQVVVGGAALQMVGVVESVTALTADVDILTDAVQVEIMPASISTQPSALGFMYVKWDEELQAFVTDEPAVEDDIQVTDMVYLRDIRFPPFARGFAVGQVSKVLPSPKNPDLFKRVIIQPLEVVQQSSMVNVLVPELPKETP